MEGGVTGLLTGGLLRKHCREESRDTRTRDPSARQLLSTCETYFISIIFLTWVNEATCRSTGSASIL